jgi:hypothetical protein
MLPTTQWIEKCAVKDHFVIFNGHDDGVKLMVISGLNAVEVELLRHTVASNGLFKRLTERERLLNDARR